MTRGSAITDTTTSARRRLACRALFALLAFAFGAALKSLQADFVRGGEMPTVNRRLMKAAKGGSLKEASR